MRLFGAYLYVAICSYLQLFAANLIKLIWTSNILFIAEFINLYYIDENSARFILHTDISAYTIGQCCPLLWLRTEPKLAPWQNLFGSFAFYFV